MSTELTISSTYQNNNWLSKINPYDALEKRIHAIALSHLYNNLSEEQFKDLQQGFKLGRSWIWHKRMTRLLSSLSDETIKAFMLKILESKNEKEIEYYFNCCSNFLSQQTLLNMGGFNNVNEVIEDFKVRALTKSTFFKSDFEKEGKAIWKEFVVEFKYFIHQVLETLVCITGINDVTREKHRDYRETRLTSLEANSKIEIYLKLIGYPAALFGLIYSYIEYKVTAIFLTSVVFTGTIATLVAYNRYWKPCPIDHSGLKNLSIEILKDKKPIYPRRDILRKIEAAFQAKKGVLLVGEPGEGKSWIVRSFVEQSSAGKICNFIKNPQIFSCNGSSLVDFGPNNCSLVSVEDRFKNYRDQVVFFFDEFQTIFKGNHLVGDSQGEQIKTFCEDFKYVIGATTPQAFNSHIANQQAIANRRFEIIDVPPMRRDELKIALSQHLASEIKKIDFSPDIFEYIIDSARKFNPNTSTTDASFSLLDSAIQMMTTDVRREIKEEIFNLENQLASVEQIIINGEVERNSEQMNEVVSQLKAKKERIDHLKLELNQKNAKIMQMNRMEAYHRKLKRQLYSLANLNTDLTKSPKLIGEWVKLHVKINLLSILIAKERTSLKLPLLLDKSLIDTILATRNSERKDANEELKCQGF